MILLRRNATVRETLRAMMMATTLPDLEQYVRLLLDSVEPAEAAYGT